MLIWRSTPETSRTFPRSAASSRVVELRVAGPAALLTAKAIKISERMSQADAQRDRLKEKDALDAYRILRAVDTAVLVQGFTLHRGDEPAAQATAEAIEVLRMHGSTPEGRLAALASTAVGGGDPTVRPAFAALVTQLLSAL